jgi:hypothetical protein
MLVYAGELAPRELAVGECIESCGRKMIAQLTAPPGPGGLASGAWALRLSRSAIRAALYLERFGKGTLGTGWYSFDHKGVHFIALNNSLQVDAMGGLGAE